MKKDTHKLKYSTHVGFIPFILATAIGPLPFIAQNVYIGSFLNSVSPTTGGN
jgi:uncharacterized membrane protein YdjX (TVP38/TMEM64 family)